MCLRQNLTHDCELMTVGFLQELCISYFTFELQTMSYPFCFIISLSIYYVSNIDPHLASDTAINIQIQFNKFIVCERPH